MGRFFTDEEERRPQERKVAPLSFQTGWHRNENQRRISPALKKVAKEVGTGHITAVAIAYVMQKTPYVFPIIGGRKVEHLMANIEALQISLSDDQIKYLEGIIPFDPGFPYSLFGNGHSIRPVVPLLESGGREDRWPFNQPIKPSMPG